MMVYNGLRGIPYLLRLPPRSFDGGRWDGQVAILTLLTCDDHECYRIVSLSGIKENEGGEGDWKERCAVVRTNKVGAGGGDDADADAVWGKCRLKCAIHGDKGIRVPIEARSAQGSRRRPGPMGAKAWLWLGTRKLGAEHKSHVGALLRFDGAALQPDIITWDGVAWITHDKRVFVRVQVRGVCRKLCDGFGTREKCRYLRKSTRDIEFGSRGDAVACEGPG